MMETFLSFDETSFQTIGIIDKYLIQETAKALVF